MSFSPSWALHPFLSLGAYQLPFDLRSLIFGGCRLWGSLSILGGLSLLGALVDVLACVWWSIRLLQGLSFPYVVGMQLTSLWWSISLLRVSASFKWSLFGVENFGSSSDWDDCAFSRRSIFSFNLLFSSIISSIPFCNSLEPLPLVCTCNYTYCEPTPTVSCILPSSCSRKSGIERGGGLAGWWNPM